MKILFFGDIVGKPGRRAYAEVLPHLKHKYNPDFIVVNGENASGGKGITPKVADDLFALGTDVITTGNHVWSYQEIFAYLDKYDTIIRPLNFNHRTPGHGTTVIQKKDLKLGVAHLVGRIFMSPVDCPFEAIDAQLETLRSETPCLLVDFHAEATSEKEAMGWFLDGKAGAVLGTHTHVPTADARILPKGTAYITDVGMVGPMDAIIGFEKTSIIDRFRSGLPARHTVAKGPAWICAAYVKLDPETGKATDVELIKEIREL